MEIDGRAPKSWREAGPAPGPYQAPRNKLFNSCPKETAKLKVIQGGAIDKGKSGSVTGMQKDKRSSEG